MKHQQFLSVLVALLFAIGLFQAVFAQKDQPPQNPAGEIVTLYAHDPIANDLSLNDGKPGAVIQSNLVFNRDSHIVFDQKDIFRVGIQGGEDGVILDLGSVEDLRSRYGYAIGDTGYSGQGFASIHLEDGQAVIVKDYRTKQFQPLLEFDELGKPGPASDTAPVVVGHTYLVRITYDKKTRLQAKLKVLAFVSGQFVTIRWARL